MRSSVLGSVDFSLSYSHCGWTGTDNSAQSFCSALCEGQFNHFDLIRIAAVHFDAAVLLDIDGFSERRLSLCAVWKAGTVVRV